MKQMGHCVTHLWVSRDATMSFSRSHNFCIYVHPLLIYLASSSYNQLTNTMRTTMSLSQPTALARAFKILLNTTFHESAYPHIKFPMQHSYTKYLGDKKKASTVFDLKSCDSTDASDSSEPELQLLSKQGGNWLTKNNENVCTNYIEYKDGTIVDGDTAKSIQVHTWAVIIKMKNQCPSGELPANWALADIILSKYFMKELYVKFPYLWLGCDNWKVLYLASHSWPHTIRKSSDKWSAGLPAWRPLPNSKWKLRKHWTMMSRSSHLSQRHKYYPFCWVKISVTMTMMSTCPSLFPSLHQLLPQKERPWQHWQHKRHQARGPSLLCMISQLQTMRKCR